MFFGCYRSTHLKVMANRWALLPENVKNEQLNERIKEIWDKAHPHQIFPENFCFGNSTPKRAQLFCFAEDHTNMTFRKFIGETIDKHYRPGDIILVEGVDAGTSIKTKLTAADRVTKATSAMGWDQEVLQNGTFPEYEEKYKRLTTVVMEIEHRINKNKIYYNKTHDADIKRMTDAYEEFATYVIADPAELARRKGIIKELIDDFKNGKFNESVFVFTFLELSRELEVKGNQGAKYRHETAVDRRLLKKTFQPRNVSLCKEIDKHTKQGRRVFLIAGAAHLISLNKDFPIADVKKCINKKPFVLFTPKQLFHSGNLSFSNNRDLKQVSHSR